MPRSGRLGPRCRTRRTSASSRSPCGAALVCDVRCVCNELCETLKCVSSFSKRFSILVAA